MVSELLCTADSCFVLMSGLRILTQPKNVSCQPGDKVGFSIKTSKTAQTYQWFVNRKVINNEDKDYDGSTAEVLSINRCLPKHKGSYQCIITTELDTLLSTEITTLKIGMHTELCQPFFKSPSLSCPRLDTSY